MDSFEKETPMYSKPFFNVEFIYICNSLPLTDTIEYHHIFRYRVRCYTSENLCDLSEHINLTRLLILLFVKDIYS